MLLSIERRSLTEMARVRFPAEASLVSESEVALDKCCVAQVVQVLACGSKFLLEFRYMLNVVCVVNVKLGSVV